VCINIQLHPVELTVHSCADSFSTLRLEIEASSETLGSVYQTTRWHTQEDGILKKKKSWQVQLLPGKCVLEEFPSILYYLKESLPELASNPQVSACLL